jgi:outer membrane protein OmpA-like peptidoglycan-associated protein/LysM repeat protein
VASENEPLKEGVAPVEESVATEIAPTVEEEQKITTISEEDVQFYVNLDSSKQKSVDRIIAMEYLNEEYKDSQIREQDDAFIKSIGATKKTYLSVLVAALSGTPVSAQEASITNEAFSYYSGLAPSLKGKWNRLVARQALVQDGNKFRITAQDAAFRMAMTEEDRSALNKLKTQRFENQRILSENVLVERNDDVASGVNFQVAKFENPDYNYISANGNLYDNDSGEPKANISVEVVDQEGKTVAKTITNQEGKFAFEDIPKGEYKIVSGDQSGSASSGIGSSFFVKDLKVKGYESGRYQYSINTNIYFDFDSYQLRPEALITLQEIASAYKEQRVYIQLKSHADNVGAEDYNLNLSKQRNDQALEMLKGLGVKVEDMEWLAMGQSRPIAANDNPFGRQFNRRIEIQLKSEEPIDYQPVKVYLVRPKGTMYSISKNFNVPIGNLQKINGLQNASLEAYKPLRIPNPNGVKPNLDMLVELNQSVALSDNIYVVKEGENVTTIAERYNLPEELIMEMNGLTGLELSAGQKIQLYIRGN